MKTRLAFLIACFLCNIFTFASDGLNQYDENESEEVRGSSVNKKELLRLVNEARAKGCMCGGTYYEPAEPLTWNDVLESAAQQHSDDMYESENMSHTGSDGSNPGQRISELGYAWATYGENVAHGYHSEQAVIAGWLKSAGHCKNMMNPNFTEMGIAVNGDYWTQVFAKPRDW